MSWKTDFYNLHDLVFEELPSLLVGSNGDREAVILGVEAARAKLDRLKKDWTPGDMDPETVDHLEAKLKWLETEILT